MLATPPPPLLQEAIKKSTEVWQQHLHDLFSCSKDRFPDVVWELTGEDDDEEQIVDEVWGHKAIVYARAPPSFQSRYFSFRPNPSTTQLSLDIAHLSRTPSPVPTLPNTSLLRISTCINPALFSNELEYLYTGQGFGEAFEFLFDSAETRDSREVDGDALRIDKLRKDLVFMWRSRLYSDVRIALSGNFSSNSHENTTAIFSSHRFILVSRSSYFHDALINWPINTSDNQLPTITLPSPPFTPASLHFTLGFIYTGTLVFSHRTYDLSTAFAILRAALYLNLTSLHDEVQARIAHEMLHGLFHTFLSFPEYERLTGGKWGTGGCRCRQCARRAPRVLEFALEDDVKNTHLERGARRALVGLFGEGWCTQEFAMLNPKIRESLLKGVAKRTTPQNVFSLLFAAEHALTKLSTNIDSWADNVREMILNHRKLIDEVICKESDPSFSSDDWMLIMQGDGIHFDDAERVDWVVAAVMRGVKEPWAATLYQTLVSSVLLRPHPTEPNSPFLASTSQIRDKIEQTRMELVRWITKRWLQIRQEHGFDSLEGWAIKELSDYMEVPIDDLLNPIAQLTPRGTPRGKQNLTRPVTNHPHTSRIDTDSEAASSMRVSVLSRNLNSRKTATSTKDSASTVSSSASSVRSSRSGVSTSSAASDSTIGRSSRAEPTSGMSQPTSGMSPARRIVQATRARDAAVALKDRPDSKLTPASPTDSRNPSPLPRLSLPEEDEDEYERSLLSDAGDEDDDNDNDTESVANSDVTNEPESRPIQKTVITRASLASVASRVSNSPNSNLKPKSSAASVRSQASTATRKSLAPSATSRVSLAKSTTTSISRPISRGSSRTSTTGSTISRTSTTTTSRSTTTGTGSSRPVSSASSASASTDNRSSTLTSESAASYRTASSGAVTPQARSRKSSAASNASSIRTAGRLSPLSTRSRKISGASVSSVNSNASSSVYGTAKTNASSSAYGTAKTSASASGFKITTGSGSGSGSRPPVPRIDPNKLSPVAVKSRNTIRSVKSVSSLKKKAITTGTTTTTGTTKRSSNGTKNSPTSSVPGSPDDDKPTSVVGLPVPASTTTPTATRDQDHDKDGDGYVEEEGLKNTSSTITIKPRKRTVLSTTETNIIHNNNNNNTNEHKKTDSTTSNSSNTTIKKKRSNETIIGVKVDVGSPMDIDRDVGMGMEKSKLYDKPHPPLPPTSHTTTTTRIPLPNPSSSSSSESKSTQPRGATLEIGIPCIVSVSSKRRRFKAYARYIGEVEGEFGPWVGVEVPIPIGENWADRDNDEISGSGSGGWNGKGTGTGTGTTWNWNDGSWGGVKYFEIGNQNKGAGGDWDYSYDDRASLARRRRGDGASYSYSSTWSRDKPTGMGIGMGGSSLKREGDQLGFNERMKRMRSASPAVSDTSGAESRGLFVRPQQVLYVVDAMEDL